MSNSFERQRNKIVECFVDCFTGAGFNLEEPEPIIPRNDVSTLFTCATITPLKHHLVTRTIAKPGHVVVQRCLRVQNLKLLGRLDTKPEYMSHFTMIGVLADAHSTKTLRRALSEFLVEELKLDPRSIQLAAATSEDDLINFFGNIACVASRKWLPEPMTWKYGLGSTVGRGIDVQLIVPNQGSYSVGQLVEISDGVSVIGYEFGFGVETLLARTVGVISPFAVSEVGQYFPYRDCGMCLQLMDAISTLAILYANDIHASHTMHGSIARKLVKMAPMLADRCGVPWDAALKSVTAYIQRLAPHGSSAKLVDDLSKSWALRREALRYLNDYALNQVSLARSANIAASKTSIRITRYGEDTGRVWPEEILDVMKKAGFGALL